MFTIGGWGGWVCGGRCFTPLGWTGASCGPYAKHKSTHQARPPAHNSLPSTHSTTCLHAQQPQHTPLAFDPPRFANTVWPSSARHQLLPPWKQDEYGTEDDRREHVVRLDRSTGEDAIASALRVHHHLPYSSAYGLKVIFSLVIMYLSRERGGEPMYEPLGATCWNVLDMFAV